MDEPVAPMNMLARDDPRRVAYERAVNARLHDLEVAFIRGLEEVFGREVECLVVAWEPGEPVPFVVGSSTSPEAALEYVRALDMDAIRNSNRYMTNATGSVEPGEG